MNIEDLSAEDILGLFQLAETIKKYPQRYSTVLRGKVVGLLFEKPSLRTRVSFEVGIRELGGCPLYLSPQEVQLGIREAVKDVAKTLSGYLDGVVLRTFSHRDFLEFCQYSEIPVMNGLTDFSHPVQVVSDLFTLYERNKKLRGLQMAFIGDGNNVCNSLLIACAILGISLKVASPTGYQPSESVVRQAQKIAMKTKTSISIFDDPLKAAVGTDVLYTDVWASMGQEKEKQVRVVAFKNFRIDSEILKAAKPDCLVMHCLPAHRGEEITDEVLDGKHSIVFTQAENRLYAQKAIMVNLFQGKRKK